MATYFSKSFFKFIGLLFVLCCVSIPLSAKPLRMVSDNVGIPKYAKGLLKLILSKVPEHKYEWDDSIPPNTEGRIVRMEKLILFGTPLPLNLKSVCALFGFASLKDY